MKKNRQSGLLIYSSFRVGVPVKSWFPVKSGLGGCPCEVFFVL